MLILLSIFSAIQLARKCTSSEFRRFIRSQNMLPRILASFRKAHTHVVSDPATSLKTQRHFRDLPCSPHWSSTSMPETRRGFRSAEDPYSCYPNCLKWSASPTMRSFASTCQTYADLRGARLSSHLVQAWSIVKEWREKSTEKFSRELNFALTEDTLSVSFLILEALAYTVVRESKNAGLKDELLNIGCLQWLVARSKLSASNRIEQGAGCSGQGRSLACPGEYDGRRADNALPEGGRTLLPHL